MSRTTVIATVTANEAGGWRALDHDRSGRPVGSGRTLSAGQEGEPAPAFRAQQFHHQPQAALGDTGLFGLRPAAGDQPLRYGGVVGLCRAPEPLSMPAGQIAPQRHQPGAALGIAQRGPGGRHQRGNQMAACVDQALGIVWFGARSVCGGQRL